ncbi:MAG: hypothetical protein NZ480_05810 [Bdellovibrionaceae bacterium]|nr:hypothetical protein [Pseudobdellovibrionaceae bacterium]MDW8190797.1 hypothetical protein [Pseudobdellovibrionaceae bacterium]
MTPQEIVATYAKKIDQLSNQQLLDLADAYKKMGNNQGAIRIYEFMIQNEKGNDLPFLGLGRIYWQEKKYNLAVRKFAEALEKNNKDPQTYIEMGQLILESKPKNFVEVRMLYEDLVHKFGPKLEYEIKLCELATLEGQHELAKKNCEKVLKKEPQNFSAQYHLILVFKDTSQWQRADQMADELLKNPSLTFEQRYQLAMYFEERGNVVKALSTIEPHLTNSEASAKSLAKAATWSCSLQNFDPCYEYFRKACIQDSKVSIDIRKAMSFIKMTKDPKMIERFELLYHQCFGKKLMTLPAQSKRKG